ncbi:hypothetical protein ACFVMC_19220 [Nocardia sp. NPDC127579]|uniref:hypothetical protein n=1 Tax=Nocardia sp. NPDC127579 TaxID=3345402 RepID=UPI00363BD28B
MTTKSGAELDDSIRRRAAPSGRTAYAAATLALLGALAMAIGSFMAAMESANTKPYEVERGEILDWLTGAFGIGAGFLLLGAIGLFARAPLGRGLIVIGTGFALAGHAVGLYLVAVVLTPGAPLSVTVGPAGFAFFSLLLAFPTATLWSALTRSTSAWLDACGTRRPAPDTPAGSAAQHPDR